MFKVNTTVPENAVSRHYSENGEIGFFDKGYFGMIHKASFHSRMRSKESLSSLLFTWNNNFNAFYSQEPGRNVKEKEGYVHEHIDYSHITT